MSDEHIKEERMGQDVVETKKFNRRLRVNRFVLAVITFIALLMCIGYISDFQKGNIGFGFMLIAEVVVIVSLILDYVVFFKQKDGDLFKYVSIAGYIVMYALVVLGGKNDLVFTIAFPITVMYVLYFDYRLVKMIATAFGTVTVADLVYVIFFMKHLHSGNPINTTSLLLQGACVITYMVVICGTTRISNDNNDRRLRRINEEKEKNAKLLEDVLVVVRAVRENSTLAEEHISQLTSFVESSVAELQDISRGTEENTSSIENQTQMTESIQSMIADTKAMSDRMLELSKQSEEAVTDGQTAVRNLLIQSGETRQANEQVVQAVDNLIHDVKSVSEITEQIFSISSQTNLLALNASIESARAGEAGRGFAVVADEIRVLAEQTRTLTEGIQNIVAELEKNADIAKNTVDNVIRTSNQEHDAIANAEAKFEEIGERMDGLDENVQTIYEKIDEIMVSNNAIVESITSISAVSQMVSASTQQAVSLGADTSEKAEQAKNLMSNLMETVHKIDQYIK